ncbi:LXG domain-containing protein [Bacillus sp. FSL K6-0047]
MILDTNELITEIERSIEQKRDHRDQLQTLQSKVEAICQLETLQGEGGAAIKDYFTTLHLPVLLFFQQFIETHISQLETVKDNLLSYDGDANTLVRTEFLNEVKMDLNRVINYTRDSANIINSAYESVSDLIHTGRWESSALTDKAREARDQLKDTEDHLEETDQNNQTVLETSKATLEHLEALVRKVEGWTTKEAMLSQETIEQIRSYYNDSSTVSNLMNEDQMRPLLDKMRTGEELTLTEKMMVYYYIQNELVDREKMGEIANKVATDKEGLIDYLNEHVLVSTESLAHELETVELFLMSQELKPGGVDYSMELAHLRAYEGLLRNYDRFIAEMAKVGNLDPEVHTDKLFMGVEDIIEKPSELNMTILETDFRIEIFPENPYNITREEWLEHNHSIGFRQHNVSEVMYFYDEDAGSTMGRWAVQALGEDYENHTGNFIHGAVFKRIGDLAYELSLGQLGRNLEIVKGALDSQITHDKEIAEIEDELTLGTSEETANDLHMEVRVSNRPTPNTPNGNELHVELYKTKDTERLLERWNKVYEFDNSLPYPKEAIEEQDWHQVAEILKKSEAELRHGHKHGDEIDFYRYIKGGNDSEDILPVELFEEE